MSDKENKKINFEGVCPFCGQVSLDEECNCDGAQRDEKFKVKYSVLQILFTNYSVLIAQRTDMLQLQMKV